MQNNGYVFFIYITIVSQKEIFLKSLIQILLLIMPPDTHPPAIRTPRTLLLPPHCREMRD